MKRNISSIGLLIFVGYMWWGFVYPEFSLMEGTFEMVDVTEEDEVDAEDDADAKDGKEEKVSPVKSQQGWCSLLETEPENIVFRSKIVRKWMQ